ncbi:Cys-tRNA(Pro) deacylase, prolyl-tRNA editing enzyme YbaK/EbsC [Ruegeria marina]|uniref:Cys-tRNA(Pro) deacylase, prolyl-tRNA editing enzyme YbaK/EbsC n=1 Tax=Ruegeria marina TaxID=639004 RepID=A0A1G6JVA5_9RHOB|nr:Cys-tRNA(Pro) deacylase, prolyl-tRNA editing enzyme YbaK/EbsC [Ruegeria marina]
MRTALQSAGLTPDIRETDNARTAVDAARAVECALDQIVKSIVFQSESRGRLLLFLTAGGNLVDLEQAASLSGETLVRADAGQVREITGFAIGGVAPVGHLSPLRTFMDPRLMDFDLVWAAAGTPQHVFGIEPGALRLIANATLGAFTRNSDAGQERP